MRALFIWNPSDRSFEPADERWFERRAGRVHHEYGRLMCWITFSTGAEFFAKGVCLLNEDPNQKSNVICENSNTCNGLESPKRSFLPLGNLINGPLKKLAREKGDDTLCKVFNCIRVIRNRDAHAYVRGVCRKL